MSGAIFVLVSNDLASMYQMSPTKTMCLVDTGLQPYDCEFCEKRFARSDVRNRHMQLSHRELFDAWLQTQPMDRRRQDWTSAGQEAESADRAAGAREEDYGEIGDEDNDEGEADAEEEDPTDARHGSENAFAFNDSGFSMDVDAVSNPHRGLGASADTRTRNDGHAPLNNTHVQHYGTDLDLSRRDLRSRVEEHTQKNIGDTYGAQQSDYSHHLSMSDRRPPQPQVSFAMNNSGIPLNLPLSDVYRNGSSYSHQEDRQFISAPLRSQPDQGSQIQGFGTSANALQNDDSYAMIAGTHRIMSGARDNEEMLSRLDILLAAAEQPEQTNTTNLKPRLDHTGRGQRWGVESLNGDSAPVVTERNDSSLTSEQHRESTCNHRSPNRLFCISQGRSAWRDASRPLCYGE
jgi:hypothetical protein